MAQQYQGKDVHSVRDAKAGDPEFAPNTNQVVITLEDGSEKTVKRTDLTGQPMGGQPHRP